MSEQHVYRGASIEVHLEVLWEAYVYMPGSTLAEPVTLHSRLGAGIKDVVAQAHRLADQRLSAAMTITLRRNGSSRDGAM